MATTWILLSIFLLLVTHEAQGIVTSCSKSAFDEYGKIGKIIPPNCKTNINTECYVECRAPAGNYMSIKCNENGLWDDDSTCLRYIQECDEYSDSGVVIRPGCVRDVGTTCDVSCNGGGDMKILCNVNRQWEKRHQDVSCVRGCPKLNVLNAYELINHSDSEIGKTMQFTCHYRFVIRGPEKITCQMNYTWDHSAPFCESRRFAHEVVKAMEIYFFTRLNDNNTRDLDLIILLDVSRHERVRITVDLVKSLLLRCEENQRRIFYTLITYGREGHVQCIVCNIEQIIQVLSDVAKHQHQPAGSNLGSGLSRIFTRLLLNNRLSKQRDRILLLVTGQNPGISHNHQLWTKILREDAAFKMIVVSLDDRVSKEEMKLLADQPWQNHYFHMEYSEIHEAVGNLTNNGSGILNTTAHLVEQIKGSLDAGKESRLLIYMEMGNRSETFTLVKQVTINILHCMDQFELEVFLNMDNVAEFVSVEAAIGKLNGLQLSTLQKLATPQYHSIMLGKDNDYLQIILFISSSGRIFEIDNINVLKDMDCEIYAVGVGEQAKMQELQDLVSFPWYQHLVHASEGTVACDG